MQNPFTTTFSKAPEYTYIHTETTEEIRGIISLCERVAASGNTSILLSA